MLIAVTDTGAGMDKATQERAFDPFFTTKEVGKGTGLGLSQVYGFARQSAGHVKIYSEIGEGTTVKIYLPRSVSDTEKAAADESNKVSGWTGTETILVVEDDERVEGIRGRNTGGTGLFGSDARATALPRSRFSAKATTSISCSPTW